MVKPARRLSGAVTAMLLCCGLAAYAQSDAPGTPGDYDMVVGFPIQPGPRAPDGLRQDDADVTVQWNVMVPMRDGVRLSTDIFRPSKPGKYPVVLLRDFYSNGADKGSIREGHRWAKRGYVFIHQEVRGRFDSEGTVDFYEAEIYDGYDTQMWISTQPWSSGRIGMVGLSYQAGAQWLSAPLGAPAFTTMVPMMSAFNWYQDAQFPGGAFTLFSRAFWTGKSDARTEQFIDRDWAKVLRHLPLATLDRDAMGQDLPALRKWLEHPNFDAYWQRFDMRDKVGKIDLPALHIGGWYDALLSGTLAGFVAMRKGAATARARAGQKLIIGPWSHAYLAPRQGEVDFGPQSVLDLDAVQARWMDHWLKGEANGVMDEPPVRLFIMGENKWRDEQEWPLARTKYTRFYIHGASNVGGALDAKAPPAGKAVTRYTYDPENPAPTKGGNIIVFNKAGPYDQSAIERRSDVLVFSTPELERDTEVTGPITMTLYASSSAPDTDFTVKLTDVHPDGKSYILSDGIIRARYRESFSTPKLMTPGQVYKFEITLGATSNLFRKGHRIRVAISSSNFPQFDRNPNTGADFATDAKLVKADQTIYHSRQYPSHITLPIIPR
jgi:putative CocE/NonD family hydrolase